jgi:hypothetical protein
MMTCIIASIIAMSVPGRGWTKRSPRDSSMASAVGVRIGSITTSRAPLVRAVSIVGHRCRFVSRVLVPHRMISRACSSSSASMPRPDPLVMRIPWPTVGPQIARSSFEAPMWAKNLALMPIIDNRLWLPASENGRTASAPWASITACRRRAVSASASSQLTRSNAPEPFGPTRRIGCRIRSGEYTRSRKRFTFGHSSPAEYGWSGLPRSFTATGDGPAASSTVTVQPQESGQS